MWLLQHHPHGDDIILCIAPIAGRVQVPEQQRVLQTSLDAGGTEADFSCHKVLTASRTFMIEADRVAAEQAVRFAVNSCQMCRKRLGATIRGIRIDGRLFILRTDDRCSKDLPATGMQEPR